jgi:hypothetical protein
MIRKMKICVGSANRGSLCPGGGSLCIYKIELNFTDAWHRESSKKYLIGGGI